MSLIKKLAEINSDNAEALKFIRANKAELVREKKRMPKNYIYIKADPSKIISPTFDAKELGLADDEVFIVGNSVGFMDSHDDVSLKGSWTKTVQEQGKRIPVVKDHTYTVDNLYAQNMGAMLKEMPLRALGYDAEGMTEVIAFKIKPYSDLDMRKYQDGTIKQHSMGLSYQKLVLAVNNPEWEEEYEDWQKYIGQVINRDKAEELGYFWGIQEQKAIEVSSVVLASNPFTPAYTSKSLLDEPPTGTQEKKPTENNFYSNLIRKL